MDTAAIHGALDEAEKKYHETFAGKVPDEVQRFKAFLATLRMVVDQSADMAGKEE